MVLGCYYLTMDAEVKKGRRVRVFATEEEAILGYRLREKTGATLHEPIDVEVKPGTPRPACSPPSGGARRSGG
jgi:hypothetical protein